MKKSVTLSYTAMLSSLLLLLAFLVFWLQSEYKLADKNLEQQANFLFVDNIRAIEDEFFFKLLEPLQQDSLAGMLLSKNFNSINIIGDEKKETEHILKNIQHTTTDTTMRVILRAHSRKDKVQQLDGSIAMFIDLDEQQQHAEIELRTDGFSFADDFSFTDSIQLLELIQEKFDERIVQEQLDWQYAIEETPKDSNALAHFSSVYYDTYDDKNYGLQLHNKQALVLASISQQFVMAFILFGAIALAFYMIYNNLQEQKRLSALKSSFVSNITHELKTPITTVSVAIEAMSSFNALKNPQQTQEYLKISQNELKRLSILVDKVLKMSMFEGQEPELKLEWINLKELTQEIINTMKLQFDKFAAEVQFQFSGQTFDIQADRIHITSVLYNLIDNALKYSKDKPQIAIELNSTKEHLELRIQDQGMGIPKVYQKQVFDQFFRVPTGNTHNAKGYGLGLSYVAEVVRKHQGSIALESEEGQGSCFTILLPTHD